MTNQFNYQINFLTNINKLCVDMTKIVDSSVKVENSFNSSFTKIQSKIDNIRFTSIIQQVQYVSDAIANLSQPGIAFEQSMADLSAITGIAGGDLEYLGKIAKQTGADSGLGASQASEAFKLLASQIDVSKIGIEGLTELQKQTITLAQASGMSMGDAANSLAGTINQFGLSADQANRVINVLAAGSKYGAAEIPELAQSFKVVGAAANAAGLSVESTAGAIEVLSKNNLKGAEAGTALRNIVLKMQTQLGVDFGKTSITEALESLKPKLQDATYLSKLFGMENVAAAQFLITNSSAVEEMTARVTGSGVAAEQATIRTNTMAATMAKCRATIDNLKIGFVEGTGAFGGYATILAENAVLVSQMIPLFNLLKGSVFNVIGVVGSSVGWLKSLSLATKIQAGWAKVATAAQWLWSAAMSANPIGLVVAGIAALVTVVVLAWNKFEGFRKVVFGTWECMKEFGSVMWDVTKGAIANLLEGLGAIGSALKNLFSGNFSQAWIDAKEGVGKLASASPIGIAVDAYAKVANVDFATAYEVGAARGVRRTISQSLSNSPLISSPERVARYQSVAQSQPRASGGKLNMSKMCESININVANTDQRGKEQIQDDIFGVLNLVIDAV